MSHPVNDQVRIAKSSMDAASGYATASFAAYADFASQALGFWAQAIDSMIPKPEPKSNSWYRHPDAGSAGTKTPTGTTFNPWAPWLSQAHQPAGQIPGWPAYAQPMMNPFALWMKAWPLQGNPAAWPMAFAMMGSGVSRDVAYPTAEANIALMDAVGTASKSVNRAFSSYRSDSGYASAQIIFQPQNIAAAFLVPLGAETVMSWLGAASAMQKVF